MTPARPPGPHTTMSDLFIRAFNHMDETRLKGKYRYKHYTINSLSTQTGINRRTLLKYFGRYMKASVTKLDLLMAIFNLDALDLLTPPDIIEVLRRGDQHLLKRVKHLLREVSFNGKAKPGMEPEPDPEPEPATEEDKIA